MRLEYEIPGVTSPKEDTRAGVCSACGEEITGSEAYCDCGMERIHGECFWDYLRENYSQEELADALLLRWVVGV